MDEEEKEVKDAHADHRVRVGERLDDLLRWSKDLVWNCVALLGGLDDSLLLGVRG